VTAKVVAFFGAGIKRGLKAWERWRLAGEFNFKRSNTLASRPRSHEIGLGSNNLWLVFEL